MELNSLSGGITMFYESLKNIQFSNVTFYDIFVLDKFDLYFCTIDFVFDSNSSLIHNKNLNDGSDTFEILKLLFKIRQNKINYVVI